MAMAMSPGGMDDLTKTLPIGLTRSVGKMPASQGSTAYDVHMTSSPADHGTADSRTLTHAISKNEEAKGAVQEVADELAVVHAVLTSEVEKIAEGGDAAAAVERTAELQKKLDETADKMAEVNESLAAQNASLEHLSKSR